MERELSNDEILDTIPNQYKILNKNLLSISKEAIELLDLNLAIYDKYYRQFAEDFPDQQLVETKAWRVIYTF